MDDTCSSLSFILREETLEDLLQEGLMRERLQAESNSPDKFEVELNDTNWSEFSSPCASPTSSQEGDAPPSNHEKGSKSWEFIDGNKKVMKRRGSIRWNPYTPKAPSMKKQSS
jgi:hypothetical protein